MIRSPEADLKRKKKKKKKKKRFSSHLGKDIHSFYPCESRCSAQARIHGVDLIASPSNATITKLEIMKLFRYTQNGYFYYF